MDFEKIAEKDFFNADEIINRYKKTKKGKSKQQLKKYYKELPKVKRIDLSEKGRSINWFKKEIEKNYENNLFKPNFEIIDLEQKFDHLYIRFENEQQAREAKEIFKKYKFSILEVDSEKMFDDTIKNVLYIKF